MKHYMDIRRLSQEIVPGFRPGDRIIVQEKIDGANFSIRYDRETDSIKAFSRKRELSFSETLRGAWNWSQSLDVQVVKRVLGDNLILFAEWLVSHTVVYPKERYSDAYCYDVYDDAEGKYLPQEDVKRIVSELGLNYVPVFYDGPFTSWDDLRGFVGKTELGGEYGEGIVIKNQTRLNSPDEFVPFYTKIVADKFCETKKHNSQKKVLTPEESANIELLTELTASIVTEARVRKLVNKLVDDGILRENWSAVDMSTIAKNIGKNVYEDCVKEEPEIVMQIGEKFGKFASSTAMNIVRGMLKEREYV